MKTSALHEALPKQFHWRENSMGGFRATAPSLGRSSTYMGVSKVTRFVQLCASSIVDVALWGETPTFTSYYKGRRESILTGGKSQAVLSGSSKIINSSRVMAVKVMAIIVIFINAGISWPSGSVSCYISYSNDSSDTRMVD
ncbi:hypothetical protein M441DRAFT_306198 [Trichoderma asperellum CBS 433.97]|uniref:Uncharacterized protein n=1 Tax=Trichoderma asperellum (strain ATCC 204424 / CBS 433.97 / NBRC 101777) TaxID=1042311 RepID=A0A2T3ZJZ2_TRIA4|nr:hypothetical protein M441DRAFT_306198 [Trichoderma asperellum CBS 433.97]PTB45092.1 hypothetical protein M441DRAFT_306198 [Trichoderma asperellum CBS 433.97]